jgi:PAS domain S-box-containing protein
MDLVLTGISGSEAAAIVRQHRKYDGIPVVFLSSETRLTAQIAAVDAGRGDDFLVKPISPDQLIVAVISKASRARALRRETERASKYLGELSFQQTAVDAHAIVSVADVSGKITYVNDKFCQISGYSRRELLGQNHRILNSGLHPPEFFRDMWETICAGKVWQGRIRNIGKNSQYYWVESTIVPFLDENGIPYQYVSLRTDITRSIEERERLRRSQIYANIGTWDWDIQTGDLFWSERIAPLFGYEAGELETTYENFVNAIHPDDRQVVTEAVNACVENGTHYVIEHRVVWPDGQVRWVLEQGDVVRDARGKPMHMLGVVQDITERKNAELALAERERQLVQAQAMARLGSWQANMATGELVWSDEIYRIFGHHPGAFQPSVQAFHAAVHPDDLEHVYESERRAEQTGRHDVVHRIVRPDGTIRYVHELANAEKDLAGKVVRLLGTVQDITEQKQAELEAQQERDRAQRYLDTAQTFMVSLDLNGSIMMINRKGCELLGYTEAELVGANWFERCLPSPLGMETVYPLYRRILAGELDTAEYIENPVRAQRLSARRGRRHCRAAEFRRGYQRTQAHGAPARGPAQSPQHPAQGHGAVCRVR